MQDKEQITPIDVYNNAIEQYKVRKRALNECEIEIDIARMQKDTVALRRALSCRNRLLDCVIEARENIQNAAVEVVRAKGMVVEAKQEHQPGLMQRIIEKIVKI